MNHNFKKIKALSMIFLIISLTFYTSISFRALNGNQVSDTSKDNKNKFNYFEFIKQSLIQDVDAQGEKVCCQRTKSSSEYQRASCVYTEIDNCDLSAGNPLQTSCEQTDYCKQITCINVNGQCQENVEASTCIAIGGTVRESTAAEIGQCQVGCCNLPSGSSITSQAQCGAAIKDFPDLNLEEVFDESITDEQQCVQQSRGTEEGCCVLPNSCSFGTRNDCSSQGGDFKLNTLCSYSPLGCPVTEKSKTGCYEGKVYWFDSTGNRENIYGTTYRQDGQAVLPKDSCKLDNEGLSNNLVCGNCEYTLGTVCDDATNEFKSGLPSNLVNKVNNQCVSLACVSTEISKKDSSGALINPWMNGERRENVESWCEYQGKTGEGDDLVGSDHYLHRCVNGKEVPTRCDERRNEICVQNDIPGELIDQENLKQKTLTFADCVPNNWEQCLAANGEAESESCGLTLEEAKSNYFSLYPNGDTKNPNGPCDVFRGLDEQEDNLNSCILKTSCREKICEEEVLGNCYFNQEVGLCAPSVPPGTLGKETSFSDLSEDRGKIGFNFECREIWVDEGTFGDWDCEANCACKRSYYADKFNDYCTNLGDLGASYNVVGYYGKDGFIHKRTSTGDAADIAGPADGITKKNFNLFSKNTKPLSGDFLSLLSAISIILVSFKNLNKDTNLEPGYFGRFNNWVIAAAPGAVMLTNLFLLSLSFSGTGLGIISVVPVLSSVSTFLTSLVPSLGLGAIGAVILAAAVLTAVVYVILNWLFPPEQAEVAYQLTCNPYTPPKKGDDCGLCNDKDKFRECTEYLCTSLGKACELIGSLGNQTCIWRDEGDTLPVIIEPLAIAPRTINDLSLTPPSTGRGGGYEFKETLKSFDSIGVGIKIKTLDKSNNKLKDSVAECKISRKINFEYDNEGEYFTQSSQFLNEHERKIFIAREGILPEEDRIELESGKENVFYVKCKSVNDNVNANSYFIKVNVAEGPDLSPPLLKGFNIPSLSYIKYDQSQITNLILYYEDRTGVNANGGCKYSEIDQDYSLMENNMSCSQTRISSGANQGQFACSTNLKLISNQDNKFYFACQDKSQGRYTNTDNLELELKISQQLKIVDQGPDGDVLATKVNLTITTQDGAENGKAKCFYAGGLKSLINKDLTFSSSGLQFTSTNSNMHETKLSLQNEEDYIYYLWCRDVAGNEDSAKVEFHTTTPELIIEDAQPNGKTFYTGSVTLEVKTSGGIKGNGDTTCRYEGDLNGYINDDKEISNDITIHKKELPLIATGTTYNLNIICTDQYRTEETPISFTVNYEAYPQIIRVYRIQNQNLLNIVLNNPAECHYSTTEPGFDYETSNKMVDLGNAGTLKQVQINSDVIYIKCKDDRTDKFGPPSGVYRIYP